jgi:hypothetical protein
MKVQKITLPIGIVTSIQERSRISAAISNLNASIKYMKQWLKNAKENPTQSNLACLDYAVQWGIKYKNEFYSVEHLANLYHALWLEKYSKAKLTYEKTVAECEAILKTKVN